MLSQANLSRRHSYLASNHPKRHRPTIHVSKAIGMGSATRRRAHGLIQLLFAIQLSLLFLVNIRRHAAGSLVVGNCRHLFSIGRNRDLVDTNGLAVALVGYFD